MIHEERAVDELVAEANRMLYMEGLAAYSGHVSIRDPDNDEVVHINPLTTSRGNIRPVDVVKITTDSEPVDPDAPDPVAEAEIHTSVYRNRPDVNAVLHIHPPYATLFGITGTPLVPAHIRGSILTDGEVPVFDRPHLITTAADGEAMVEAMDGQNQVLFRNHGGAVADTSIKRAFVRAIYLEMNAYWLYRASLLGNPKELTQEEVEYINSQNWQNENVMHKFWHFYQWKAREQGYLPEEW